MARLPLALLWGGACEVRAYTGGLGRTGEGDATLERSADVPALPSLSSLLPSYLIDRPPRPVPRARAARAAARAARGRVM